MMEIEYELDKDAPFCFVIFPTLSELSSFSPTPAAVPSPQAASQLPRRGPWRS
jgi:hypothetical protein